MIDEDVKQWIIAMYKALGLGKPVFADAEPVTDEAETGADAPETPDISEERAALAARLDKIDVPERLPNEEALQLVAKINAVKEVVANIKTPEGLAKATAGVDRLVEIAEDLRATMTRRLARANELVKATSGLKQPDMTYLKAEEAPDVAKVVEGIAADLGGQISDTTLELAESAIRDLAGKLTAAKSLAEGRKDRSAAVLAEYEKLERPAGGGDEDYDVFDADVLIVEALKGTNLGETEIAAAEAAMSRLKAEGLRLTALFEARAQRANSLEEQLDNLNFEGVDAASGLDALKKEQAEITTALSLAKDDKALDAAEAQIAQLAEKINVALETRAAGLKAAATLITVPDTLPEEEAKPLKVRLAAIISNATPPLQGSKLIVAAQEVVELPVAIKAAMDALEDRNKRFQAALDDVAKLTDPDDANATEKATLKALREAAALTLVSPLSEEKTLAAEAAAKVMAEKHAELTEQIKQREEKRAQVLKTLLALAPPNTASAANMLRILKEISAIRARIEKADTEETIDAEDSAIKALDSQVKEVEGIAAARIKANAALAAAEQLVKGERETLFAGGYSKLMEMLSDAAAQIDKAKNVGEFQAAETEIAKIQPYLMSIKAYRDDLNKARIEAEFHIEMMNTTSSKTGAEKTEEETFLRERKNAMRLMWFAVMAAADKLAAQGKIAEAGKELAKFKTQDAVFEDPRDGSTKTVKYVAVTDADALAFPGIMKEFMEKKYPTVNRAQNFRAVMDVNPLNNDIGNARSKGFSQGKWADAAADIATLSTLIDTLKAFLDAYEPYRTLLETAGAATTAGQAFTNIKADCAGKNYAAAKTKVLALDTAGGGSVKKDAEYAKRRGGLQVRVDKVLAEFPGAISNALSTPWSAAETEADHGKRMKHLDDAELALTPLMDLMAARDAVKPKVVLLDDGSYKILEDATAFVTAGDLAKAKQAYLDAVLTSAKLAEYLSLKDRLTQVKASYDVSNTDAIKTAQDALDAADKEAKAKKLDEAQDTLNAVLQDPSIALIDQAITLFKKRKDTVEAQHNRVLGAMQHANAQKRITEPWATILSKETSGAYLEALTLLDAHVEELEKARPYVEARTRAHKALKALHDVADKIPATEKGKIYAAPLDRAKMDADLAKAEADAIDGKFEKATKAFNDLVAAVKGRMDVAAKALEEADHGHFLSGHGPDVSKEATLARMTTGIRPDGEKAPSNRSSQFTDIGDFMMCYSLAWEHAKGKKSYFGGNTIKTTDTPNVSEKKLDVGQAIGMGVEGLGQQTGFAKGVPGPTALFDTYEVTEGVTKLQYKFIFHFTPPQSGSTEVITTHRRYAAAYRAEKGVDLPPGTDCPGHWALNQLLPGA
ncbi:MAG: hypothetical protein AB3N11_10895 [Arenibacterium sp.]